jgi:hypothetical protein
MALLPELQLIHNQLKQPHFVFLRKIYLIFIALRAGRPTGRRSSPGSSKNFLYVVQYGSEANPAFYPIILGGLFPRGGGGEERPDLKVTSHIQLVPMSIKGGSAYPFPHTPTWCSDLLVKRRDNFCLAMNQTLSQTFSKSLLFGSTERVAS